MKIKFYTPSYEVSDDVFGAATFGFVGAENEREPNAVELPHELEGDMVCGSYEECLKKIEALPKREWQVGIVLFGNAGGENAFLRELSTLLPIPFVGGGAAIHPETQETALLTGRGQVAVFLVCDDRYDFEVERENIHYDILGEHEIAFSDPRRIDSIDGQEPCTWLKREKEKLGLCEADFEHLTFADARGNNAHLSLADGRICSGRDLEKKMYLRYVSPNSVWERMQSFYDDENAIVFGCAGLRGILEKNMKAGGMGLFLFGEVCTKDGESEFANLMLSKLRILPKK